jgi:hypothetical protein
MDIAIVVGVIICGLTLLGGMVWAELSKVKV